MTYTIQYEASAPCYASEADKERGAEAYRATVSEGNPALIAAADWARANGFEHLIAQSIMDQLDSAELNAETAVTEGWANQVADSGVSYRIDLDAIPEELAQAMDDDLREELHSRLDCDTDAEWLVMYAEAHKERFGEDWAPISGGAW